MKKIWTITKREYLENVRTKAFIISTIITPLILFMFAFSPTLLLNEGSTTITPAMDLGGGTLNDSNKEILVKIFSTFFLIMLYTIIIINSGSTFIRGMFEEKANRVVEILLSSCTAKEVITGKLTGLSLYGLTQIGIWFVIGIFLNGADFKYLSTTENYLAIIPFFLTGYLFYASFFLGLGSIIRSEQTAQYITGYISLLLFIPIILMLPAFSNPGSMLIKFFSYIPFTSTPFMFLRVAVENVSASEMIIVTIFNLLWIGVTVNFASYLFKRKIV